MNTARVRDVMRRQVQTAARDEDLEAALQRMLWAGIRHLPVVQKGAVVGMLSQRDIFERLAMQTGALALGHPSARQLVEHAMRVPAISVSPDETVGQAARMMAEQKLGALVVVEGGAIAGIVTTTDLLAELGMAEAMREAAAAPDVGSVMTKDPVSVWADESLSDAIKTMVEYGIRHLPVVDREFRVVGMLSDRDVRAAVGHPRLHVQDPRAVERTVGQVMTGNPFVVQVSDPILRAVGRFIDERIGALPVVDPGGKLVGILSYLDVLRFLRGSRVWGEGDGRTDGRDGQPGPTT